MIKKVLRILFVLSCLIFLFAKIEVNASIDDRTVERKILTKVEWSEIGGYTRISQEYIIVSKIGDEPTDCFKEMHPILATDLKYKDVTREKIEERIKEDAGLDADVVYGHYLKIFADVHNKKVNIEELNKLTDDAIEQVDYFYSKKKEIASGKMKLSKYGEHKTQSGSVVDYLWPVGLLFSVSILVYKTVKFVIKLFKRKK